MHRTLKAETAKPGGQSQSATGAFDRFRREYNEERPHEALKQQTPASHYRSSPRSYPERIAEPEYAGNFKPKQVYTDGTFFWKGTQLFITKSLGRETISLKPVDDRYWDVYFPAFPLVRFDRHRLILQPKPDEPQPSEQLWT